VKGDRTCPERHKKITFLLKTETEDILEKAAFTSVYTLSEPSASAAAPAMCAESPY